MKFRPTNRKEEVEIHSVDENIDRREALKKASLYALSTATMMMLMKSQPAMAQSPLPPPPTPNPNTGDQWRRTTRN